MSTPSARLQWDFMELIMNDFEVEMIDDGLKGYFVYFHGPKDSPYYGGVWKVGVFLTDYYPYEAPVIFFDSTIYHPNIEESLGSIGLDVIAQNWSPVLDLVYVFEMFLPQLLLYPNPSDPLNEDAASLLMGDRATYDRRVEDYCERYCASYTKPEDMDAATEEKSSNEELSEDESDYSDEQVAGRADP